jgi:hypothetical protein
LSSIQHQEKIEKFKAISSGNESSGGKTEKSHKEKDKEKEKEKERDELRKSLSMSRQDTDSTTGMSIIY